MIAGVLELQLRADVARLSKDMGEANQVVQNFATTATRAMAELRTAFGGLGGVVALGSLMTFITHAAEAQDQVFKLSQKVGIAVDELSAYKYALGQSDVSLETFGKSVKGLAQKMTEANDSSSKASRIMSALGVDLARGTSPAIEKIADTFAALPDGATKAALAVELFGKAGMEMIPFLNQGRDGIRAMKEEAARLGLVMNEDAAKAAEKFNDNLKAIKTSSERLGIELVNSLGESLVRITGAMKEASAESGILMTAWVALGGIAAEALGLNTDPAVKRLREITAEMGRLQDLIARGPKSLGDGIFDRGPIIAAQLELAKLRKEMELLKAVTDKSWKPQEGGAFDFGGKLTDRVKGATEAQIKNALATDKQREAHAKLSKELELQAKWWKIEEDERERTRQEQAEQLRASDAEILRMRDGNELLQKENELIGATRIERELALNAFQMELALRKAIDPYQRDAIEGLYKERAALIANREAAEQALEIQRQQAAMWNLLGDAAGNFFSDLVLHGRKAFDNLRQYVKQLLADMIALFAKRWVLNMAAGGSVGGSALDAIAGGTGSDSLVGAGLNAVGSWLGGTATAGSIGAIGSGVFAGGTAGGSVGIGVGASGSFAMGAEGAGMMSGVYEALAAIPVWGWIAMAVIAAVAFFAGKGGGPKVGGSFFQGGAVPGTDNGRFFTPNQGDAQMKAIVEATSGGFLQAFKSLGGSGTPVMNFGLGYDHDPNGSAQSRVSAMLTDAAGKILYNQHDLNMDDKEIPAALQLQAQRMILAALQASDLPKEIADILNSVTADTATSEQIQQAIAAAREMKAVMDALGHLEWGKLDVASLKAMALEGETISQTFQRIAGAMGAFDDAFLSDAQKFERASKHVTDVFASLGIAVPKTTAELVALVHGLDLSTAAGRNMFNMLMSVFPDLQLLFKPDAPDNFTTAVDHATNSVNDFSASLSNPARDLGDWLNKLIQDPNLTTLSLQQRYDQARRDVNSAFRLRDAGGIQSSGQQYLDLAKQLFGQGSPAYTAIFQSFYEQASKLGVGARPFQEAFNAALPKVGTMASSADLNVQTRILGGLLKDVADVVTEAKNEIKGLRKDVKDSTVKPFGA